MSTSQEIPLESGFVLISKFVIDITFPVNQYSFSCLLPYLLTSLDHESLFPTIPTSKANDTSIGTAPASSTFSADGKSPTQLSTPDVSTLEEDSFVVPPPPTTTRALNKQAVGDALKKNLPQQQQLRQVVV